MFFFINYTARQIRQWYDSEIVKLLLLTLHWNLSGHFSLDLNLGDFLVEKIKLKHRFKKKKCDDSIEKQACSVKVMHRYFFGRAVCYRIQTKWSYRNSKKLRGIHSRVDGIGYHFVGVGEIFESLSNVAFLEFLHSLVEC